MIDPNLLRKLGWNEDLIAEVNRVARSINVPINDARTASPIEFAVPASMPTQSGTTFQFESGGRAAERQ